MLTFWTAHSSFFILFSLISIPVIGLFARAAIRFGQQWIFSSANASSEVYALVDNTCFFPSWEVYHCARLVPSCKNSCRLTCLQGSTAAGRSRHLSWCSYPVYTHKVIFADKHNWSWWPPLLQLSFDDILRSEQDEIGIHAYILDCTQFVFYFIFIN